MRWSIVITVVLFLLIIGCIAYRINLEKKNAESFARNKALAEEAVKKAALEEYKKASSELAGKISTSELNSEQDLTSLMQEVEAFKNKYKDRNDLYKIKAFQKSIADKKLQRISGIMEKLASQAAPFITQKEYGKAAKLYINYNLSFHTETLSERARIHDSLLVKENAFKQHAEEKELLDENKRAKEKKALHDKVTIAIVRQNPRNAYDLLKASPYVEDLKTENKILTDLVNVDDIVLRSFASDSGQTINVILKKGGSRKFQIVNIKNNKITVRSSSGKVTIQKKISPDMLGAKEKGKRLAKIDKQAAAVYYGLALLKQKQYRAAETSFSRSGPFADILSAEARKSAIEFDKESARKLKEKLATAKAAKDAEKTAEAAERKKGRNKGRHPCIFSSQEELDYIKKAVKRRQHPMHAGWEKMLSWNGYFGQGGSSLRHKPKPYETVYVFSNLKVSQDKRDSRDHFFNDAQAAYSHALQWVVTGKKAHSRKSIEILNAWSAKFKQIQPLKFGNTQRALVAGWAAVIWVAAAEIIRYYNNGTAKWSKKDIKRFSENILDPLYEYCTYLKYTDVPPNPGGYAAPNQPLICADAKMAIGVFQNRKSRYRTGRKQWEGLLRSVNASGENYEICRDSGHAQYVIICLVYGAELAWHQGDDLYGIKLGKQKMPRLWYGLEYLAKLDLGIPQNAGWRKGGMKNFKGVGVDFTGFEMALNHYKYRAGLELPYTEKLVKTRIRPVNGCRLFIKWDTLTHAELDKRAKK